MYCYNPYKRFDTWPQAFGYMMQGVLQDGLDSNVQLPEGYAEIERMIGDRLGYLEEIEEPRLVHWDLHDANIMVSDNLTISGILDCDRAIWGDPLMEFYFTDFFDRKGFTTGYGAELPGIVSKGGTINDFKQ